MRPPGAPAAPAPAASLSAADREEIHEAVFRALLDRFRAGYGGSLFLAAEGRDPDPTFLARLRGGALPVRPGSEFVEGKGVRVSIGKVTSTGRDAATVDAGSYAGPEGASGCQMFLERRGGRWTVVEVKGEWTS